MPKLIRLLLLLALLAPFARAATPEATIEAYFAAAQAGDKAAFAACLTDEFATGGEKTWEGLVQAYAQADVKTEIVESVSTGPDTHEIKFRIEMKAKDGKGKFSGSEIVQLVRKDDRWLMAAKGTKRDSSLSVQADADGKKPHDYIATYVAAINTDNLDAVLQLYSPAFREETVSFGAGDPQEAELQAMTRDRILKKTESYTINHAHCGFHKNSAPGVYSVALELVLTDAYLEEQKAKGSLVRSKKYGTEVCFVLIDGRWRITSKLKGK